MKTIAALALLVANFAFAAEPPPPAPSILGQWKTFDDKSGEAKGLVEIKKEGDEFKGYLLETYAHKDKTVCDKCSGDKKDKPLKGLEIIWAVKEKDKDEWGGGHILDPENGETYKVKFELQDEGKKLKVRGYLGISLLGRTQYWLRK